MHAFILTLLVSYCLAQNTITLNAIVRDFTPETNRDFESYLGSEKGIVEVNLGSDGKPVPAPGRKATVTSAATFNQWFRDTSSSIRLSTSLTLTKSANSNVYTYSNSEYFPIDGQGFGNYDNGHNYHFTTEIHTTFGYNGGETFTFSGDDDVFVFINNKLVIDLGGVHETESQSVNLDTLGLTIGNNYPLDIFQAERSTPASTFGISTTLVLAQSTCGNGIKESEEECDGGSCCTSECKLSMTAPCFCSRKADQTPKDYPEYYCVPGSPNKFYMCVYGVYSSQSATMSCGAGTKCGCAASNSFDNECSCNATQSPCVLEGNTQNCNA